MKTLLLILITSFTLGGLSVSGTYESDFGALKLKQQGTTVTGNYSYTVSGGQSAIGTIKGSLKGLVLTFTWSQTQGSSKAGGSGSFVFSKDAKSFKGTWKDSKGKSGTWNGKK